MSSEPTEKTEKTEMDGENRSVSVSPETDDFAARYDRMVEPGSGSWVIKWTVVAVVILGIIGAAAYFLGG